MKISVKENGRLIVKHPPGAFSFAQNDRTLIRVQSELQTLMYQGLTTNCRKEWQWLQLVLPYVYLENYQIFLKHGSLLL
ncbi:hypothetical protein PMI05_00536 [Brevibacillus sp. BC25]|nr:hypothetical protein PMI05_00536 [Brevibacillus sp. BC25]